MITLIAAIAKNRVVGKENKMPWHLPEELKRFKKLTTGKVIIMGRKTYESIGKPLPNRINIVVSSTMKLPEIDIKNSEIKVPIICRTLEQALEFANNFIKEFNYPDEIMVIGGSKIWEQTISVANKIELTVLHKEYDGDAFFPDFDLNDWKITNQEHNKDYTCFTFEK